MKRSLLFAARFAAELLIAPAICVLALVSRFFKREFDIGLGPEPLINNVYHRRALIRYGYKAETFVTSVYVITDEFDHKFISNSKVARFFAPFLLCWHVFKRYKALYIYFNGGPLLSTVLMWRIEPWLFRLADIRIVVMPYGSDIMSMDRCPNYLLRHVVSKDYPITRLIQPRVKRRVDLWLKYADHVIAGCDWVDYLYHWDTLMLAHFSIDTDIWKHSFSEAPLSISERNRPLRVLHAPNHRESKGTRYFIQAVEELKEEGVLIDFILVERVPNHQIHELMKSVDVVADQLIAGWYAMFALEGMSLGKPVLCYLRDDLKMLYTETQLVKEGEIPIINCRPSTVKETLRQLVANRAQLVEFGRRGREFVEKHHSLDAIGKTFNAVNRKLGVSPGSST